VGIYKKNDSCVIPNSSEALRAKILGTNQDLAKQHYIEFGFNEGRNF
tara:strand:+ start:373 stop:513 length:141 start_codon:yes stop_codon:yes gene_type:complete